MTTIAYRDGVLAADSACAGGDIYRGRVVKLAQLPTVLVAACGTSSLCRVFREWMAAGAPDRGKPVPREDEDLEAIVIRWNGAVEIWRKSLNFSIVEAPFYALGSGNELALGAMAMGANAVQAAEIACQFDLHSALPVLSARFADR